ncbi:MAG: hypothetical protein IIZ39_04870 [Blautia sp.]|nr:hypothetical protein [Blautia sp.]
MSEMQQDRAEKKGFPKRMLALTCVVALEGATLGLLLNGLHSVREANRLALAENNQMVKEQIASLETSLAGIQESLDDTKLAVQSQNEVVIERLDADGAWDRVEGDLSQMNIKYEKLSRELASLSSAMTSLEQLDGIAGKLGDMESHYNALYTQLEDLKTYAGGEALSGIDAKLDNITAQYGTLTAKVSGLEASLEASQPLSLAKVERQLDDISTKYDGLLVKLSSLEDGSLSQDVAALQSWLTSLSGQYEALLLKMDALTNGTLDAEGLEDVKVQMASLAKDYGTMAGQVRTLKTEMGVRPAVTKITKPSAPTEPQAEVPVEVTTEGAVAVTEATAESTEAAAIFLCEKEFSFNPCEL